MFREKLCEGLGEGGSKLRQRNGIFLIYKLLIQRKRQKKVSKCCCWWHFWDVPSGRRRKWTNVSIYVAVPWGEGVSLEFPWSSLGLMFGMDTAVCEAQNVLRYNAETHQSRYPLAGKTIRIYTYGWHILDSKESESNTTPLYA